MEKVENIQEQMGNVSRKVEIPRIKRKFWKSKIAQQNEDVLTGSPVHWTCLRK